MAKAIDTIDLKRFLEAVEKDLLRKTLKIRDLEEEIQHLRNLLSTMPNNAEHVTPSSPTLERSGVGSTGQDRKFMNAIHFGVWRS